MRILLALDGSDASMTALAAAAALPLPPDTTIELLTVVADDRTIYGGAWPAAALIRSEPAIAEVVRDVRGRLEDVADRLEGPDRTVRVAVREGRAASEILAAAADLPADLIIMGARGQSAIDRVLLGSVSAEVVDHAPCPVLVARTERVSRVLVATDGSPAADAAIDLIGTSSLFADATVRVMSVTDPGMPWWTGGSPVDGMVAAEVYGDMVDAARDHAREVAAKAADRLGSEVAVEEAAHRGGDVPTAIVAEATDWDADIVAVGSRGQGMVRRLLLGSVSRDVLHHAPMSVLVVRAPGEAQGRTVRPVGTLGPRPGRARRRP